MSCPLCGTALGPNCAWCDHVVAWMGPGGFRSPLDGIPLPWLAGTNARKRWPSERVAEAFGDLAPLVDAYAEVADWRPGMSTRVSRTAGSRGRSGCDEASSERRVLWPLVAEALDGPIMALTTGEGETAHTYWVAAEPQRIAAEARAIASLLGQGYDYLSRAADRGLTAFRAATATPTGSAA